MWRWTKVSSAGLTVTALAVPSAFSSDETVLSGPMAKYMFRGVRERVFLPGTTSICRHAFLSLATSLTCQTIAWYTRRQLVERGGSAGTILFSTRIGVTPLEFAVLRHLRR
jgi:hypothetical protein